MHTCVPTLALATLLAMTACTSRTPSARTTEADGDAAVTLVSADAAGTAAVPTDDEKRLLLSLARSNMERRLQGLDWPQVDPSCVTPYLQRPLACFVTLTVKDGPLRGCVGMFEAQDPLYRNVMDRALAAAFSDTRFPPVQAEELPDLVLEISILTAPQPLQFSSPQDLLAKLRPEIDGVILRTRWGSSTFLPQIWEQIPDGEQFLGRLCEKHGAPSDCWREEGLRVEIYQAIVFSETEQPARERDWFVRDADGAYRCQGDPG